MCMFPSYLASAVQSAVCSVCGLFDSSVDMSAFCGNAPISHWDFYQMVHANKQVFCFFRALKGDDRNAFLDILLHRVNSSIFERHNLKEGGISLAGWMNVLSASHLDLENQYRLFDKVGDNLYHIKTIGDPADPRVDLVMFDEHMTRARVAGKYPTQPVEPEFWSRVMY